MKTKNILTLVLWFVLLTGCQQKKDDPEILKNILTEYFDGIKNQDLNKLNSLTTSDFILFENGKIWTNDSLISTPSQPVSGTWTFDSMKIFIDESSGDITYFDHGEFIFNDTTKNTVDWLESATFRKINGEWKMNFLHSTIRK